MEWWQSILLGIVQGLTEFLPVSSSGHLLIFKELLGVEGVENFWDFTMIVHLATVLSTIVVFFAEIKKLLGGFFKFKNNDEMDYCLKIAVSMIPVMIVGLFFKDAIDAAFSGSIMIVGIFLVVTAVLLFLSDQITFQRERKGEVENHHRNGISYWQAFVVGLAQSFAVAPGLSRSGTTIAVGLMAGVKKNVMAQFSFLMVLVPIVGEQFLSLLGTWGEAGAAAQTLSPWILVLAFLSAFLSGLFACKVMISIVRKSKLTWFSLYCLAAALLIFIFG